MRKPGRQNKRSTQSGSYRADAMAHKHQQNRDAAKPIQCWRVSKLARLLTYGFRLAK